MLLARRTAQTIFGGWCGGMAISAIAILLDRRADQLGVEPADRAT